MDSKEFRSQAHRIADWVCDYFENLRDRPVRSRGRPFDVYRKIPTQAPRTGEDFEKIFTDFNELIVPHMTHWQHPRFGAYFPANVSPPSILAEWLTAGMGAQCMAWATSPAATELELRVCEWLRDALGFSAEFSGVIQDAASMGTMTALLCARERAAEFASNRSGMQDVAKFSVYCSEEAHSSVEKGMRIVGLGSERLRKVPVDAEGAMLPDALRDSIAADLGTGLVPIAVVSAFGTTGQLGVDPLAEVQAICEKYRLWHHIDAAYLGAILLLDEYKHLAPDFAGADSIVFNPHKWMFTNFDCSLYFFKDRSLLGRTLAILPEYLKTPTSEEIPDLRDWSIGLGRRFRALKLWFVLRSYGTDGLAAKIREHLEFAKIFHEALSAAPGIEVLGKPRFNLVMFRKREKPGDDLAQTNQSTLDFMHRMNQEGFLFLSHCSFRGKIYLRWICGQSLATKEDVVAVAEYIKRE